MRRRAAEREGMSKNCAPARRPPGRPLCFVAAGSRAGRGRLAIGEGAHGRSAGAAVRLRRIQGCVRRQRGPRGRVERRLCQLQVPRFLVLFLVVVNPAPEIKNSNETYPCTRPIVVTLASVSALVCAGDSQPTAVVTCRSSFMGSSLWR